MDTYNLASYVQFPIRCYSCGYILSSKQDEYEELLRAGYDHGTAMDALGIDRFCCRQLVLSPPVINPGSLIGPGAMRRKEQRLMREKIVSDAMKGSQRLGLSSSTPSRVDTSLQPLTSQEVTLYPMTPGSSTVEMGSNVATEFLAR